MPHHPTARRRHLALLGTALWLVSLLPLRTPAADDSPAILKSLAQRAAQVTAALPPLPETREAWDKQRGEMTKHLAATLGLPEREPMKAAVTDRRETGDVVREEVAFLWAERAYATANVFRGKAATGKLPAVVITSGYLGHHSFLPYRQFVASLVRRGMLVLFIDDPRTGLRQSPPAGLYAVASAAGTPMAGIQVHDALRALDYLLTRPDVDAGRIGIAGWGEGAMQAYLAAALEPRFQFVIAGAGTTTFSSLIEAAAEGPGSVDSSVFVPGLLSFGDVDRIAACVAPRPALVVGRAGTWPPAGYLQAVRTLKAVYKLVGADDQLRVAAGAPADSFEPYGPEIDRWLESAVLPKLKTADAPPSACAAPQEPDFCLLNYFQRRLAQRAPQVAAADAEWQTQRGRIATWLRTACGLDSLKPVADEAGEKSEGDIITEPITLGLDAALRCPASLVRPAAAATGKRAAVILSHDDRGCSASPRIAEAARRLAGEGYCVIVPDHASIHNQSRQRVTTAEQASFYGDDAARFYGPADALGLPPLGLRVAENLAAFRHLAARPDVDPAKIAIAGLGLGAIDACLAAVLEERIVGVAAIDVTTVRDWAMNVAPRQVRFFHLAPTLPAMPPGVDLDACFAAIAPRPLTVVRLTDGWPKTGFEQATATASAVYKLRQAEKAFAALGPRDVTDELFAAAPAGAPQQVLAAARTLVPAPPQSGLIGSLDGLKSRATTDSASGLIWLISELNGYEQEFAGANWQLDTWAFFNDNGAAQRDRSVTPLLFRKDGERYVLTGVGKTRTNTGAGLQRFPFEPVAGTAQVGDGYYFGWHDGDPAAAGNSGVVEFEDAPDALMTILTGDGRMDGQRLKVNEPYRIQSQYHRQYSIMATSKKP